MKRLGRLSWTSILLLAGAAAGCQSATHNPAGKSSEKSGRWEPLDYAFPGLSGRLVDSTAHRGRTTVLLFITTFDVFSQAQASRLEDLVRSREPRINAAAVVLEAPRNAELVTAFVEVLELSYPVAVSDSRELSSHAFFQNIRSVPAWVFLDADGRPQAVGSGALSLERLNQLLDGFTNAAPRSGP